MSINCICCGSDKTALIGNIPPAIYFAGKLLDKPLNGGSLVRCQNCNLTFRHPQLEKTKLDELYREGSINNWQTESKNRPDWKLANSWISGNLKAGSSILDVGCFDGAFLNSVQKECRFFGIEIHEEARKKAEEKEIQIIGKDFEDHIVIDELFDLVTSFDVIEHALNPLEFLENIAKLTKVGGSIIITTGNTDAFSWRLMGARYWYCFIPEHYSFINQSWCEWASKKIGLDLENVIKFSHAEVSFKRRIIDAVKNIIYTKFPRFFSWLRRNGMGGNEYRVNRELLNTPPSWMSSKDHIICIFRKNV